MIGTPDQRGMDFESLRIRTSDGLSLHAWFLPVRLLSRIKYAALRELPGGHNDGLYLSGRRYVEALDHFLTTHLGGGGA
jgi:hypothetical protein